MNRFPILVALILLFGASSSYSADLHERRGSEDHAAPARETRAPAALRLDDETIERLPSEIATAEPDIQIAAIERLSAHLQATAKSRTDLSKNRGVAAIETIAETADPRVQTFALRQLHLASDFEGNFDGRQTPTLALARLATRATDPEVRALGLGFLKESEGRLASFHGAASRALNGDGPPTLVDDADFAEWGRQASETQARLRVIRPAIEALTPPPAPPLQVEPTWHLSPRAARWLPASMRSFLERRNFHALIDQLALASGQELWLAAALRPAYDKAVMTSEGRWSRFIAFHDSKRREIDFDQSPVYRAFVRYAEEQGFELSKPQQTLVGSRGYGHWIGGYRSVLTPRARPAESR